MEDEEITRYSAPFSSIMTENNNGDHDDSDIDRTSSSSSTTTIGAGK